MALREQTKKFPNLPVGCSEYGCDLVKDLLEFYMGKNTMERQNFIIENLVVEEDITKEE